MRREHRRSIIIPLDLCQVILLRDRVLVDNFGSSSGPALGSCGLIGLDVRCLRLRLLLVLIVLALVFRSSFLVAILLVLFVVGCLLGGLFGACRSCLLFFGWRGGR